MVLNIFSIKKKKRRKEFEEKNGALYYFFLPFFEDEDFFLAVTPGTLLPISTRVITIGIFPVTSYIV